MPKAPDVLYVLDSSFNPPTLAHFRIAISALKEASRNQTSYPRLLLLLATQNADKPSKPAPFEDRLTMMHLLARDLQWLIYENSTSPDSFKKSQGGNSIPPVDIGLTKQPYFVDKAAAIATDGDNVYPEGLEQVHLTGYDTLVRIFDPKYYPPTHTLNSLDPFLSQHRLRVTLRPDDAWGGQEEQRSFFTRLGSGILEELGGKREWAKRIEISENEEGGEPVSSTMARNAARENQDLLDAFVISSIREYITSRGLYNDL